MLHVCSTPSSGSLLGVVEEIKMQRYQIQHLQTLFPPPVSNSSSPLKAVKAMVTGVRPINLKEAMGSIYLISLQQEKRNSLPVLPSHMGPQTTVNPSTTFTGFYNLCLCQQRFLCTILFSSPSEPEIHH